MEKQKKLIFHRRNTKTVFHFFFRRNEKEWTRYGYESRDQCWIWFVPFFSLKFKFVTNQIFIFQCLIFSRRCVRSCSRQLVKHFNRFLSAFAASISTVKRRYQPIGMEFRRSFSTRLIVVSFCVRLLYAVHWIFYSFCYFVVITLFGSLLMSISYALLFICACVEMYRNNEATKQKAWQAQLALRIQTENSKWKRRRRRQKEWRKCREQKKLFTLRATSQWPFVCLLITFITINTHCTVTIIHNTRVV